MEVAYASADFKSKAGSAALSGSTERFMPRSLRPNTWSEARFTDSMPTNCPALYHKAENVRAVRSPRTTTWSYPVVRPAICSLSSPWSLQNHGMPS